VNIILASSNLTGNFNLLSGFNQKMRVQKMLTVYVCRQQNC